MSRRRAGASREHADVVPCQALAERRRGLGTLVSRTRRLIAVLALFLLLGPDQSRAQERLSDSEIFHLAVDYCREPVPRPMALSSDQRILCFDGWVDDGMDLSPAHRLQDYGLFVVRSFGGHAETAVALSHLLRDRHVTVVVYDYCLSTCANSFFIASDETYVIGGALVAWRNQASEFADCTSFGSARDERLKKIAPASCPPFKDVTKYNNISSAEKRFYSERTVDPVFQPPPASAYVMRSLRSLYDRTAIYVNVGWTLNPRYYRPFKSTIVYEAYPNSQQEVDAIVARLRIGQVIYDP